MTHLVATALMPDRQARRLDPTHAVTVKTLINRAIEPLAMSDGVTSIAVSNSQWSMSVDLYGGDRNFVELHGPEQPKTDLELSGFYDESKHFCGEMDTESVKQIVDLLESGSSPLKFVKANAKGFRNIAAGDF